MVNKVFSLWKKLFPHLKDHGKCKCLLASFFGAAIAHLKCISMQGSTLSNIWVNSPGLKQNFRSILVIFETLKTVNSCSYEKHLKLSSVKCRLSKTMLMLIPAQTTTALPESAINAAHSVRTSIPFSQDWHIFHIFCVTLRFSKHIKVTKSFLQF